MSNQFKGFDKEWLEKQSANKVWGNDFGDLSNEQLEKMKKGLSKTVLQVVTECINGNVPSKSNCYKIVAFNGHASLAKTKAMKDYEDKFFIQCKSRNAMIGGYFELHLKVFYPSQRSDLDNSLKVILDCLQKTKTIVNDNKCVKIIAEKFLDKLKPRIEFEIREI